MNLAWIFYSGFMPEMFIYQEETCCTSHMCVLVQVVFEESLNMIRCSCYCQQTWETIKAREKIKKSLNRIPYDLFRVRVVVLPFALNNSVLLLCLCRSMLSWWVTLPSPMTTSLQRLSPTLRASTASPWWGSPPACPSTPTRWVMDEIWREIEGEENRRGVNAEWASEELPWGGFKSLLD